MHALPFDHFVLLFFFPFPASTYFVHFLQQLIISMRCRIFIDCHCIVVFIESVMLLASMLKVKKTEIYILEHDFGRMFKRFASKDVNKLRMQYVVIGTKTTVSVVLNDLFVVTLNLNVIRVISLDLWERTDIGPDEKATLFLKELLFFGQALMFLFFLPFKPKNVL